MYNISCTYYKVTYLYEIGSLNNTTPSTGGNCKPAQGILKTARKAIWRSQENVNNVMINGQRLQRSQSLANLQKTSSKHHPTRPRNQVRRSNSFQSQKNSSKNQMNGSRNNKTNSSNGNQKKWRRASLSRTVSFQSLQDVSHYQEITDTLEQDYDEYIDNFQEDLPVETNETFELISSIDLPKYNSPSSDILEKVPESAVYKSANSRQTTPENNNPPNEATTNATPEESSVKQRMSSPRKVMAQASTAIQKSNQIIQNATQVLKTAIKHSKQQHLPEAASNHVNNNQTLSLFPTNATNVNNNKGGSPHHSYVGTNYYSASNTPHRNIVKDSQTCSKRDKLVIENDRKIEITHSDTPTNYPKGLIAEKHFDRNLETNGVPIIIDNQSTYKELDAYGKVIHEEAYLNSGTLYIDNNEKENIDLENNYMDYRKHLSIIEESRSDIIDFTEDDLCMFSRPLTPRSLTPHPYPPDLMPNPFSQKVIPNPKYKASLQTNGSKSFRPKARGSRTSDQDRRPIPPNLRKQPVLTQAHRDIIKKIQKRTAQQDAGSLYGYKSKPESKPNRSYVNPNRAQVMRHQRGKDSSRSPAHKGPGRGNHPSR